jgi:hypothetical protein
MTSSARGTIEEPGSRVAAKAGLNRSILDGAPGAIQARLGQKLAAYGGMLLLVPAALTSQPCNHCGHVEPRNRASRDLARGLPGDAANVEIAASLAQLLRQQAKPNRAFSKRATKKTTRGLAAQAFAKRRGFLHAQARNRAAATRSSGQHQLAARSSVLQGRQ